MLESSSSDEESEAPNKNRIFWVVNGKKKRRWEQIPSLHIDENGNKTRHFPKLIWPSLFRDEHKHIIDYFYLMWPMDTVQDMIHLTNKGLVAKKKAALTKGEFFKWLGIRLAMAIEPRRGPITVYWEHDIHEGSIFTPPDYERRFGMSRHRFQDITSSITFSERKKEVHVDSVSTFIVTYIATFYFLILLFT